MKKIYLRSRPFPRPSDCVEVVWISNANWLNWDTRIECARLKGQHAAAIRTSSFRKDDNLWPVVARVGTLNHGFYGVLAWIGIFALHINRLREINQLWNDMAMIQSTFILYLSRVWFGAIDALLCKLMAVICLSVIYLLQSICAEWIRYTYNQNGYVLPIRGIDAVSTLAKTDGGPNNTTKIESKNDECGASARIGASLDVACRPVIFTW